MLRGLATAWFPAVLAACNPSTPDAGTPPLATASIAPVAPPPTASASAKPEREVAAASKILVRYRGAVGAGPKVKRTKIEASKRAAEVLLKTKMVGASFEQLVAEASEDDATRAAGGRMGAFERLAVPSAVADAVFALSVGQTSEVIETPEGFCIFLRTR